MNSVERILIELRPLMKQKKCIHLTDEQKLFLSIITEAATGGTVYRGQEWAVRGLLGLIKEKDQEERFKLMGDYDKLKLVERLAKSIGREIL